MSFTQHIMTCADADAAGYRTDLHGPECEVVLCETTGEPGYEDGAVVWISHAPKLGTPDVDSVAMEDRLNPVLTVEDWRA